MSRSRVLGLMAFFVALTLLLAACASEDEEVDAADDAEEEEESPEPDTEEGPEEQDEAAADDHGFEDGDVITIVVPSDPGGGYDTIGRQLQPLIEEELADITGLDLSVSVENMPGAAHRVGTEYVAAAEPDGTTMVFTAVLIVSNYVLQDVDYDPREMTPIVDVGTLPRGFVIRPELGLETLVDVAAHSVEEPLVVGTPGLEAEMAVLRELLQEAGHELQYDMVSYEGVPESATALLRGDVDLALAGAASWVPFIEDNPEDMQFLVSLGCERDEGIEDVPSITEEDIDTADAICGSIGGQQRVLVGPAGIPPATVAVLEEAILRAGEDEAYVEQTREAGQWAPMRGSEELRSMMDTSLETYEAYREEILEAQ